MRTPTYSAWQDIKARCLNANRGCYKRYGGRGIKVCERWEHSFEAFLADMGEKPTAHTLERKNNDGNYEPGNCRWATRMDQNRNKSNNAVFIISGIKGCLAELSDLFNIKASTVRNRLRYGWTPEKAFTIPVVTNRID
jgi:hypothetical protein